MLRRNGAHHGRRFGLCGFGMQPARRVPSRFAAPLPALPDPAPLPARYRA